MQKAIIIVSILLGYLLTISAQGVKIGNNTNVADASAILDIETTDKGLLVPRMTESQRDAIGSPATGLLIFQIDGTIGFYFWTSTVWQLLGASSSGGGSSSCPATITDSRDGEVYPVVQIGNQCWMAENLRYDVPGTASLDTVNPANPSTTYGRLYDWATVMNGATTSSSNPSGVQGICPSGWHLPSDAEWNEMEMALGMAAVDTANTGFRGTDHGTKMKSTTGWVSSGNGTNASGFNVLPAGYYSTSSFGVFSTPLGAYADFWSSTDGGSSTTAWRRDLQSVNAGVRRMLSGTTHGHSCRCAKD
jgi:uncharacterized protein (TIGR02145 family)